MEFDIVEELKSRIVDPFGKSVDCGKGWHGLLADLHEKLVHIDPHYTLFQVKQKFGTLRFYYEASDPELDRLCRALVDMYELMSSRICEETGEPGMLMVRHGFYKTLNEKYLSEGWEQASQHFKGLKSLKAENGQ